MLKLRREEPALRSEEVESFEASALGENALLLQREAAEGPLWIVVRLSGAGVIDLAEQNEFKLPEKMRWTCILSTEDPKFTTDPMPLSIEAEGPLPKITFSRPGAVVLKAAPSRG